MSGDLGASDGVASPDTPWARDLRTSVASSLSSLPASSPPGARILGREPPSPAHAWRAPSAAAPLDALLGPPSPYPPRGPHPLPAHAYPALFADFRAHAPQIFGDNLVYAFVCGSVARGHAIRSDDIDTFVVVEGRVKAQEEAYEAWLEELHGRFGLAVDRDYPHEILTHRQLEDEVWPRMLQTDLNLDFNGSEAFDTVTWVDMVAGPCAALSGRGAGHIDEQRAAARPAVERWRAQILSRLAEEGRFSAHVRAYVASDRFRQDFPGEKPDVASFDWTLMEKFSLSRMISRVVPLPPPPPADAALRPPRSAIAEALIHQPTLHTSRLSLRPLEARDSAAIFDMCRRREVAKFCSWEPMHKIDEAMGYIEGQRRAAARGEATNWAIWHEHDQRTVGTIGLVDLDDDNSRATLGFALHPTYWGRGLCREAGRRLVSFLESLGVSKICADVVRGHIASQKVLTDLRMEAEGSLRSHVKKDGAFHDIITYARLSGARGGS